MNYLSVCSGIESASVAWEPLGWTPIGFAEVEPFPCHVLHHRFGASRPRFTLPDRAKAVANIPAEGRITNYGDITRFAEWEGVEPFRLLVGGTPCQSFSVAGLRAGLADPRGNLMLTYLAIADRYRPEWLVWENVPGVLSADDGRAFGTLLRGMEQFGYHAAWRVLDAQYVRVDGFGRAVPQRRRRVFVVGHLGDWRRAAAVLFDAESLRGNPPPSREARKGVAGTIDARTGISRSLQDVNNGSILPAEIAPTLNAHFGDKMGLEDQHALNGCPLFVPASTNALTSHNGSRNEVSEMVHSLIAFGTKDHGGDAMENLSTTLRAGGHSASHANAGVMPAIAFQSKASSSNSMNPSDVAATLDKGKSDGMATIQNFAVRRLMPVECERLQGFPDGWTDVPVGNKRAADGPRYKAIGNSKAVNAIRWIGRRIQMVDAIKE